MDCRETQALLNAFHDGELPAADRARVEEHLRGCPGCGALLADLARVDRAAGVPDPGPEYWERFNARVMNRVGREAEGPEVRVLRPKGGGLREQLRYLVPAAVAAALVLVIVHFGEMRPGSPTPAVPSAATKPAAPVPEGNRVTAVEPGSRATEKASGPPPSRRTPPPVLTKERSSAAMREAQDHLAARSLQAGNLEASRREATAPAPAVVPSPRPMVAPGEAPDASPPVSAADRMPPEMRAERKMAETTVRKSEQQVTGKTISASAAGIAKGTAAGSPCDRARELAGRERLRDAEAAQRECLAGDQDASSREKGLVFLAELLDRQARFSEADAVIADVEKRNPESRPLDLYLRQRPMVQKDPAAVPVTR